MSRVQVLVAAMHQTDHSLPEKMNLRCDAIIGNQCDHNAVETVPYGEHSVMYLHFAERGLALNRNNALIHANAEFCLLADDDMVYCDDYVSIVENAFDERPDADVLIFNIIEPVPTRYIIKKEQRVNYLNYLRYGSVRIAFRLRSIRENAISFNQCFGAGSARGFGEDNLFLTACLKNKLRVVAVPLALAELTEERESTWFKGYDAKYLNNKGLLFRAVSRRWYPLLCLQDALRRHKKYEMSFIAAFRAMMNAKYE